ncbi:MAG TPA: methyl-accepting chemotaxis protein [Smithella sp.]|nr:methyl-accepting chemotaxis protein [Smithella sp.]
MKGNMFNNLKMGIKLTGMIAFIFVFCTVYMLSGAKVRMNALRTLESKFSQYVVDIRNIGEMKTGLGKIRENVYHYVAATSGRDKIRDSVKQDADAINQLIQTYKSEKLTSDEEKALSEFEAAWPEAQRGYKEIMMLASEGKNDEVNRLLAEGSYLAEAQKKIDTAVSNLNNYNTSKNQAIIKDTLHGKGSWSGFLWIFAGIGAVILVIFGIFMNSSLTKPLKRALVMMKELERGHLSKRLHMNRKDEIGDLTHAMDAFADNLQNNVIFNMQQISEGNVDVIPAIIDEEDEIGPALQKMTDTIKNLVGEINVLTKSAMDGQLDVRGNEEAFSGAYREIVHGINRTLDAVVDPVNEASSVLEKMAAKDMTVRMMGDYKGDYAKIKESLNMAVENLDKALQQVAIGADQVGSASVQVSTGGQALSQGTSEQAGSLEEVSSSLQEMSSMTKQNAINAREAKGVAEEARGSSEKGVESMNRMSSAINKIKTSSDATAKIVKTIDEIAFQTNLLALNAAVEAARAGDAGKGFAVVAEEVRNLAMRSAEAAKNTANLIEEAVRNSENGVAINAEVLKNFQEITEKINKVSQVVAEIAAASEQQDQGISQVNKAVEQMNQLTQQNAANAEESASAAEEMSSQSEEMRSMVAGFRLSVSSDFTRALPSGGQSYGTVAGKKGGRAMAGVQPDPRKVIPLDESDHDILNKF